VKRWLPPFRIGSESQSRTPAAFAAEAERIRAVLGTIALRVDHNGCTSVPSLAAKPVIDIQVSPSWSRELQPIDCYRQPLQSIRSCAAVHAGRFSPPQIPLREVSGIGIDVGGTNTDTSVASCGDAAPSCADDRCPRPAQRGADGRQITRLNSNFRGDLGRLGP
jgi:hypothetical protein